MTQLDVRVYKVRDPFAFFGGLQDPHQLGTDAPVAVPQERSWIERLADWKRGQRNTLRSLARAQVSQHVSRQPPRRRRQGGAAQRVQLNVNTFAQVPLLNPDQLVTSWRELLPNHRDPEFRRVPLAVTEPGVYLVEAVNDRLRAYTIVMVSDVGVVTKTSPGQVLMFAANRFTGEPIPACDVRVLAKQQPVAEGDDVGRRRVHRRAARRHRSGGGRGALRRSDGGYRPGHVGARRSRRASWSATSTRTSRSIAPDRPSTPRPSCGGATATR